MDKTQINIFNFSTNDAEVAALMLKFSEKKMKDSKAVVNFTNMEEIKELVERKIKGPLTRKRTSDKVKTPAAKRSKKASEGEEVVEIGVSKSPKPGSSKASTKMSGADTNAKGGDTQIQVPVTQFIPIRPRPSNIQIPQTHNAMNQQQFVQPPNMQTTSRIQIPVLNQNQWQTPTTMQGYSNPQNYYSTAYPASYFQGQGMSNFASASEGEEASSDDEEEERIPFQDLTNFTYDD
uniref:Uncharacterized protein n=1 Tax=Panagrolaimus davidi TaxID=227884 RepID=A0A914PJM9_9BILA